MANPSVLPPVRPADAARAPRAASPSSVAPSASGSVQMTSGEHPGESSTDPGDIGSLPVVSPAGPRKLVRPTLSEPGKRRFTRRGEPALLAHQALADHAIAAAGHDSSHAEVFYFQKQVQTQTLMCFVLDDGEKIEGYIEWFDRNAIKVRNNGRILIYKASIKYLYKSGENLH